MSGFYLLIGHLVGDYVLQTGWQANNKASPGRLGDAACTVHCALYTAAVFACAASWMPWWGVAVCFASHWAMDRWRLARRWMSVAGQESFATGPLSPWSVVVVDNVIHLATLALIAAVAGQ